MPGNTITADLVTGTLTQAAIGLLPYSLAPFPAFSTLVEPNPMMPKVPLEIMNVTAVPTTKTNISDFESNSESTYNDQTLSPAQLTQPFQISNTERQGGLGLWQLSAANLEVFAQKIMSYPLALLTEGNFGAPVVTVSSAAFAGGDLPALMEAVKSPRRCLLLDSTYFSKICPTTLGPGQAWSHPGFPGGIYEVTDFSAAGTGIKGAVLDPGAIVVVAGLPITRANNVTTKTLTVPRLALPVQVNYWINLTSRTSFASFDIILAAGVGRTDACALIKTL